MFQEIKKYKKWKVLYNLKEPEVKISIIITLIFALGYTYVILRKISRYLHRQYVIFWELYAAAFWD